MSAVEESSHMSAIQEDSTPEMSCEKTDKVTLRKNRQKRMTVQARIKYRERTIKAFRNHLKNGTFPKRMKSIKPYPKMGSPEAQTIANAACDQVQCVILDQMVLEEQKKLAQDQEQYQTLKEQRLKERLPRKKPEKPQLNIPKKPKKPTMAQLQEELAILQANVTQLYSKLENIR